MVSTAGRARPMPPDERRESVLDAALPLFMKHGADVTTKQIADAAGIAEGTLFRAFADKQELVDAAVVRFMDPRPTLDAIEAIPEDSSLEDTVVQIITILRDRVQGVIGIMSALGVRKPPEVSLRPDHGDGPRGASVAILARHSARLSVPPEDAAMLIRTAVFGGSVAPFAGERPFTAEQLASLIIHGIAKD